MLIIATISSDLILKSQKVRRNFQRVLLNNIRQAFKENQIYYELTLDLGHVFVRSDDSKVEELLQRIFGLDSLSIVEHECKSQLDLIEREGYKLFNERVKTGSYCVRTKRKGKHDFTSEEVNHALGGSLKTKENHVKIKKPDFPIHVYIKDDKTYFFTKKIKAQGGLPLGTGGKALCLISGGFDSALASWMLQKRGVQVHYLFCNIGGKAYERSTLEVTKKLVDLWGYGSEPSFYSLDFAPLVKEIQEKVKPSFNQVVLKKCFYKAAEYFCWNKKFDAIITGEAIGQVSSQTLKNLRAIEAGCKFPLLRPLISYNKGDIINWCHTIGTYEASEKVKEFCQITKEKPVTATNEHLLEDEFTKIDFQKVLKNIFSLPKKINLKKLDLTELTVDYLSTEKITKESIVLDCRTAEEHKKHPYEEVPHREAYTFENLKNYSKEETYILFCESNTQSLFLAEKMQKNGLTAYSLKGGTKAFDQYFSEKNKKLALESTQA